MSRPIEARRVTAVGSRESRWLRRLLVIPVSLAMVATSGGPPTVADVPGGVDGRTSLSWTAERAPFQLTFYKGQRQVLAHAGGETAGPGGRLAYALTDGSTHRVTDLVRSERGRGAVTYVVATDEPARTARVTGAAT